MSGPDSAPLMAVLPRVFAGSRRPLLEALAGIDAELAAASRSGIDHGVAHAKLGWWRDEVARLGAGTPAHPLTQALHAVAGGTPDWTLLNERIAAAQLRLGGVDTTSPAALEALLYRSHGALWQLAGELLAGRRDPALMAFGAALGKGLGLVEQRAHASTAAGALAARAAEFLDRAERELPTGLRPALAPGFVAAGLARLVLARPPGAPPPGAFVQLFTAWRSARRAHRE